jgi:hypothetical protein
VLPLPLPRQDGNGEISIAELRTTMVEVGGARTGRGPRTWALGSLQRRTAPSRRRRTSNNAPAPLPLPGSHQLGGLLTEGEIQEFVRLMDTDQSGALGVSA